MQINSCLKCGGNPVVIIKSKVYYVECLNCKEASVRWSDMFMSPEEAVKKVVGNWGARNPISLPSNVGKDDCLGSKA